MKLAVVIPTIREQCAIRWIGEWEELGDTRIILVEDNPEKTFKLSGVEHYSWQDIDSDLGDDAWIIPRRTSACRSYGFLKALEGGADIIWTTDDDCYPEEGRKGLFLKQLEQNFSEVITTTDVTDGWWNTTYSAGIYPRGYPYRIRRQVMVHHGLWSNVPDLDGITQLANPGLRLGPAEHVDVVPDGAFFPFCIMNVAFRREAAPLLYMLLMGQDLDGERWGFDRFDDIWAGLFVKRTADHLRYAVTSGAPSVHHSRASDPHRNAELEAPGMAAHEDFWEHIAAAPLTASTPGGCYAELADAVAAFPGEPPRPGYWRDLAAAMRLWARHTERRL